MGVVCLPLVRRLGSRTASGLFRPTDDGNWLSQSYGTFAYYVYIHTHEALRTHVIHHPTSSYNADLVHVLTTPGALNPTVLCRHRLTLALLHLYFLGGLSFAPKISTKAMPIIPKSPTRPTSSGLGYFLLG